jgi:signal transduction histidine kinase
MDRVQRLMAEVQQVARLGDMPQLVRVIEERLKQQFEFADAGLVLHDAEPGMPTRAAGKHFKESFPIGRGERIVGMLGIEPHGAMISGETRAALELLCEQLAAALDLCRLIDEKVRLERELAERERLALVGQMAASISHNLKNPLGSMKTILQVQLENPELPGSMRAETKMVLDEIGRLSGKLSQLLQFSRPAVRGASVAASCDARVVMEEVAGVLSYEAERRGVKLLVRVSGENARVAVSAEALNDIVSNLLVNALEAATRGGQVNVNAAPQDGLCVLTVEDDGPGIPAALREKILQPFFTTKSQGTGLGLAIVARRAAEFGGKVDWESPVQDGRGTRFRVTVPLEEIRK